MTDKKPVAGERVVEEKRIPLVEERVRIDKVMREGGTVEVRLTPVEETATVREQVARETVTAKRVPIDRVIDAEPQVREEGDVTIIPVTEQRARVVVETVLVEEIHLTRERREETFEQDVTLRRTEAVVDRSEPGS